MLAISETFNSVETIAILMCKQISSDSLKNEIIEKLISYIYLYIKCYLMPPCLTLNIIRYGSRVK